MFLCIIEDKCCILLFFVDIIFINKGFYLVVKDIKKIFFIL